MKDRIQELIDITGSSERKRFKEFEAKTGIKSGTWQNACAGKSRVNEDHLNAIISVYPQYIYWIVTGETKPEVGQISPLDNEAEWKLDKVESIAAAIDLAELSEEGLSTTQLAEQILHVLYPTKEASKEETDSKSA